MNVGLHERAGVDRALVTDGTGLLVILLVSGPVRLYLDHSASVGTGLCQV